MKKIIFPFTILLLTGCLGETGKGYIIKECKKEENVNGMKIETNIKIKSKQGNIETIEITETYDKKLDIESITNSKKSEQNSYKNINGFKLDINENIFTYTLETKKLTEEIKQRYNIKEEQHKQIKNYEENGYTCK